MNIEYKKLMNECDPIFVGWAHGGQNILLEFTEAITALFSEKMNRVVVELYNENKLNLYNLRGGLDLSSPLPVLDDYQYRGINKSLESKTGISFLFHPIADSVGNKWRDTEQYEMDLKCVSFFGKN